MIANLVRHLTNLRFSKKNPYLLFQTWLPKIWCFANWLKFESQCILMCSVTSILLITLQNSNKPEISYIQSFTTLYDLSCHIEMVLEFFSYVIYDQWWNVHRNLWWVYCMQLVYLTNVKESSTKAAKVRLQVHWPTYSIKVGMLELCIDCFLSTKISESKTWSLSHWLQDQKYFSLNLAVALKPRFWLKERPNFDSHHLPTLYIEAHHKLSGSNSEWVG